MKKSTKFQLSEQLDNMGKTCRLLAKDAQDIFNSMQEPILFNVPDLTEEQKYYEDAAHTFLYFAMTVEALRAKLDRLPVTD